MSPANTSSDLLMSCGDWSSQPQEFNELYMTNALTSNPCLTNSSLRCEPIKPSDPVTSTLFICCAHFRTKAHFSGPNARDASGVPCKETRSSYMKPMSTRETTAQ